MKVTYAQVSNYDFQSAMAKLGQTAYKDGGRCAYLVKKMKQAIEKVREQIQTEYRNEVVEVYAQRDAEGKYSEADWRPAKEKEEECRKFLETFNSREAELDRPKFTPEILKEANLNADEQGALDPVLDDSAFEKMPAKPAVPQIKMA